MIFKINVYRITGYAYAHRLSEREAYQWSAELSIYLEKSATHQGIGFKLYERLIELLQKQGVRTAYACVTSHNFASESFFLKHGFSEVGIFPHAGYKDGAWHDVAWFARTIASYDAPVSPVIPFASMSVEEE